MIAIALSSYVTGFALVALYTEGPWRDKILTAAIWPGFLLWERLTRSYHD